MRRILITQQEQSVAEKMTIKQDNKVTEDMTQQNYNVIEDMTQNYNVAEDKTQQNYNVFEDMTQQNNNVAEDMQSLTCLLQLRSGILVFSPTSSMSFLFLEDSFFPSISLTTTESNW